MTISPSLVRALISFAAPTQNEEPFLIAQGAVLALFIVLPIVAVKRSHAEPVSGVAAFSRAA